jgi:hypothetical protein
MVWSWWSSSLSQPGVLTWRVTLRGDCLELGQGFSISGPTASPGVRGARLGLQSFRALGVTFGTRPGAGLCFLNNQCNANDETKRSDAFKTPTRRRLLPGDDVSGQPWPESEFPESGAVEAAGVGTRDIAGIVV